VNGPQKCIPDLSEPAMNGGPNKNYLSTHGIQLMCLGWPLEKAVPHFSPSFMIFWETASDSQVFRIEFGRTLYGKQQAGPYAAVNILLAEFTRAEIRNPKQIRNSNLK